MVSSNGGRDGIVWLMDPNALRSADVFQPDAPNPILYAFDAITLKLLWKSRDELFPSGKYNEPTVVDGLVLIGTDRLQAFGMRTGAPRMVVTERPAKLVMPTRAVDGKALFQASCAACHRAGAGGAPDLASIARMPRARIVEALTSGKMAPLAAGMTPAQIDAIAQYLAE